MDLGDLHEAQRLAATAEGPLIIIAGPGTGKTKTLAARISYLLETTTAQPNEMLALTFTNKAAHEMRERVRGQLKTDGLPHIVTFHALCYEILKARDNQTINFIDEHERLLLITQLRKTAALKAFTARELSLEISRLKNLSKIPSSEDSALISLLAAYNQALRQQDLYDFDDLLLQARELLQTERDKWQYSHILIDEFQDTNSLQYELLHLLRSTDNLCIIGDPRQAIYGFRGAQSNMFERFKRDFPTCQSITLTTNYRSTKQVVALANAVFPDVSTLESHSQKPGQTRAIEVLNEYSEAAWVINHIEQALGGTDFLRSHNSGYDVLPQPRTFRDFAILYRTHRVGTVARQLLVESGMPFQVVGEGSPYEQPAIWALMQLLCYTIDPNKTRLADLQKTPALRDFSLQQIEILLETAQQAQSQPLSEQAQDIAKAFRLTADALQQFVNTLVRFDSKPAAYLQYADTLRQNNFYDPHADVITLMSIHAAKGLEFTHVFMIAAEEGILPLQRPKKPTNREEEKRLFYVAATRAKENLDVLHAKTRGTKPATPSSFLVELPAEVVERIQDAAMTDQVRRSEKRKQSRRQMTLF